MKSPLVKSLGLADVFCISAGAMISSGIFILPGLAFARIGPAVFLAYLLAGICALVGTLATIELATAMPLAGGIYYYTERSLGPLAGTVCGVLNWSAIALKSSFAIFGMSEVVYRFFHVSPLICGIGLTGFFVAVNLIGTREAAWAQLIMVAILLAVMAGYIVVGAPEAEPGRFRPFFLAGRGWGDVCVLAAFVFVAFGGLLDVASVSEEVKNPRRDLPLGMIGAIVTVTVLYTLILIVTVGWMPAERLAGSLSPLADAAAGRYGRWGYGVVTLGALMAFVTTANAGIMAAARFPLALSRDRLIPGWFGKVCGRRQLPVPALLLTGGAIAASQFLDLEKLVTVASTVIMLSFVLTNIAVIILRESGLMNYRPSFRMPCYPVLPLVSAAAFCWLIMQMGVGAVQLSLGIVGAGVLLYFLFGRRVSLECALAHLIGRICRREIDSHDLEGELREIVRHRDGIVRDDFDALVEAAPVLVLEGPVSQPELFDLAAGEAGRVLGLNDRKLADGLLTRELASSTIIAPGIAVPHVVLDRPDAGIALVLVKCVPGTVFLPGEPSVEAALFLFCGAAESGRRLRALAAIAQTIQNRNFESRWRRARTPEQLRDIFLLGKRRRLASKQP